MKKNIKSFLFIFVLILSIGIFGANYSNIFNSKIVNAENQFSEYAVEIDGETFYNGAIECESEEPIANGSVSNYLTESSYLNPSNNTNWNRSSYDVKDYYYLTCENQDRFGMCWDFSSLKSVENFIAVAFKDYYNFSEAWIGLAYKRYLVDTPTYDSKTNERIYYTYGAGGHHGNLCNAINYYGVVYDCDMPFEIAYNIGEKSYNTYFNYYSAYANKKLITNLKIDSFSLQNYSATDKQNAIKYLKNYLVAYGAFTSCIKSSYTEVGSDGKEHSYNNFTSNSYYTDSSSPYYGSMHLKKLFDSTDHQILITGWDDNYKCNFNGSVTTGAWIAQNSWGNSNSKYFYIPYADQGMNKQIAVIHQITYNGYSYDFTKSRESNYSSYKNISNTKLYLNSSNNNYTVLTHKNDSLYNIPKNLFWYSENRNVNLQYKYNGTASSVNIYKGKTTDVSSKFTISYSNNSLSVVSKSILDAGTYIVKVKISNVVYENTFLVYNGVNLLQTQSNNCIFGDNTDEYNVVIKSSYSAELSGKNSFSAFTSSLNSSISIIFNDYCTVLSYYNGSTTSTFDNGAINGNKYTTGSVSASYYCTSSEDVTRKEITFTSLCGSDAYTFTYYITFYHLGSSNRVAPIYINYAKGNSTTSLYDYEINTTNFVAVNMSYKSGSIYNSVELPTPTLNGQKFLGWYTNKDCTNQLTYTVNNTTTIPYSTLSYSTTYIHIGNNSIISDYSTSSILYQRSIFLYPKFGSAITDISLENFTKKINNKDYTGASIKLDNVEYTSNAITLSINITKGIISLTENTDYYVLYSNNTNVGTATCLVKGKNDYFGIVTISFDIVKANNEITSIQFDATNRVATATAKFGSPTLSYSTDNNNFTSSLPTVSCIFYIKATVKGSNNYTNAEKVEAFNLNKNKVAIPNISSVVFNGQLQTADIADNDYYTVVENNGGTNAGTYKVVLTLKDFLYNEWDNEDVYNKNVEVDFVIEKANNEITNIVVNDDYSVSATANIGEPIIVYANKSNMLYSNTIPHFNGDYIAKVYVEELDNYNYVESIIEYSISDRKNEVQLPTISSTVYNGENQIADISDNDYYTVVENNGGTNTGSYNVVLSLIDPDNYEWSTSSKQQITLLFIIEKAQNQILTIEQQEDYSYIATAISGIPQILYSTEENGEYVLTVPKISGTYYVKVFVEESDNYIAVEKIVNFSISKTSLSLPVLQSKAYNGETQIADITSTELYNVVSNDGGVNAGLYSVELRIIDFIHYEWEEDITTQTLFVSFEITKLNNSILTLEQQYDYSFISTAIYGNPTVLYSIQEDGDYTSVVPRASGTYYVKAFVEESENYNAVEEIQQFVIEKQTVSIPQILSKEYNGELQIADILDTEYYIVKENNGGTNAGSYNVVLSLIDSHNFEWSISDEQDITLIFEITKKNNTILTFVQLEDYSFVATAVYGKPTIVYSKNENNDYTTVVPKVSGSYYVKAIVEESENYFAIEELKQFTITKQSISIPQIASKEYNGKLQIADISNAELYVVSKNNGGVNAGTYQVELSILDFIHYEWENNIESAKIIVNFTILEAENQLTFIVYDWEYGEDAILPYAKSTYGMPKITYSADGVNYSGTIPTKAGTYYVKAVVIETISYSGLQEIKTLTITKKVLKNPEIKDKYYNKLFQTVIFKDLPYYAMANGGTNVGSYPINIVLLDTDNYEWENSNTETLSLTYNILQAENNLTLTVLNWTYLEEDVTYPYATSTFGEVTLSYSTNINSEFVSTLPTKAGTYYVKAVVEETSNYKGVEDVKQFSIQKIKVESPIIYSKVYNAEIQIADIAETEIYTVTKNNGGVSAGSYNVNLTLIDYINYEWFDYPESATLTLQFVIFQAQNSLTLTVENWTYLDSSITPNAVSTYGIPQLSYASSIDGEFIDTMPVDAGTYYVKAEVKETINYLGAQDIKTLVISPKTINAPTLIDLTYNGQFQKTQIEDTNLYTVVKNFDVMNVGIYYIELKTINNNYIFNQSNSGTINLSYRVNQANNSLDISINNWTYGSEPSKVSVNAKFGEVVISYSSIEEDNFSTSCPTNAGIYIVRAKIEETQNYKGITVYKEFEITKQNFDTSNLIFNSKEYIYDGKAKSLTVMGRIPENIEVSYSNNNKVKTGIYEVTATFNVKNPNYNAIEPLTAILTINKKELTSSVKYSGINLTVANKNGFSPSTTLSATKVNISLADYKVIDAFSVSVKENNSQVEWNNNSILYISLPKTITALNYKVVSVNNDNTVNNLSYTVDNSVVKLNGLDCYKFALVEVENEEKIVSNVEAPVIISVIVISTTTVTSLGIGLFFLKKKLIKIA